KFGPDAQLAAVTHHWGDYFTKAAQQVIDGTWKSDSTWGGLKEGMAVLEGVNPALPDDVKQLVKEKEAAIIAGTLTPFDAPVVTNEGKVILESGSMNDDGLNSMNYYVEGITGKLPTN